MRVRVEAAGLVATGIVVAIAATFVINLPIINPATDGNGLALVKPVFAQQATTFPSDEAGISAYVNVGQAIDLSRAKAAYRTVEKETENYIIGSVALPFYEAGEDVHLYVQQDGWIVAYYMKDVPTSKIIDWLNYSSGNINTKLKIGLDEMAYALGLAITNVNYYNFGYPTANRLMIVTSGDYFKFTIPTELVVYEGSYSIFCEESKPPRSNLTEHYFRFLVSQLRKGMSHLIVITNHHPDYHLGYPWTEVTKDGEVFFNLTGEIYGAEIEQVFIAMMIVYRE